MIFDYEYSRKKTDDFFNVFVDVLNEFCIRHRFIISKSDKQASWKLFGIHQQVGHVYIDIIYLGGKKVNVGVSRNVLDYKNKKMYSKNKRIYEGDISSRSLRNKMLEALVVLKKWRGNEYDEEFEFPEWKKYKNKKEWAKFYKLNLPPIEF